MYMYVYVCICIAQYSASFEAESGKWEVGSFRGVGGEPGLETWFSRPYSTSTPPTRGLTYLLVE